MRSCQLIQRDNTFCWTSATTTNRDDHSPVIVLSFRSDDYRTTSGPDKAMGPVCLCVCVCVCVCFLSIVDTCLSCEDIARQSCAMVRRCHIFDDCLRLVFSASRMQQVSDVHRKFAPRPNHLWKYGTHPLCDGREQAWRKRRERWKKPQEKNIMACPIA